MINVDNVIIGPWACSGVEIVPPIYVILANGRPYMKDNAIRTYRTEKSAMKYARQLGNFGERWVHSRYAGAKITVGEFAAVNVVEAEAVAE